MIDIAEFTNSELEEMGIPLPCLCEETYRYWDYRGDEYDVCIECGMGHPVSPAHRVFATW